MARGRTAALKVLGYDSYLDYLRSSHWAATKKRYRASKMPQTCRICDERMVDLHHRSYKRIGHENLNDLVPLCRAHHEELHVILRTVSRDKWWAKTRRFIKTSRKRR